MTANEIIDKLIFHFAVRSDTELADKIGINRHTIGNWRHRNSAKMVRKIVNKLGLTEEIFPDEFSDEPDVDKMTNAIFLQAYIAAKENDKLGDLRKMLIEFSDTFDIQC